MAGTVPGVLLTGIHASRPSSGVSVGTLYSCTTHGLIYQTSDTGSTWATWATLGASGAVTTSGLTMATAKLLGRTTASTGAIEEITVGSGLSLSAGSLTASGSSLSHSYLGYNTIGGTAAAAVANTIYLKPFTPGSSGLLTSVGFYTKQNANGATPNIEAGIWDDVTGSPIHILGTSGTVSLSLETGGGSHTHDARWLTIPVTYYLTGGTTYWMGVQVSTTSFDIYHDGSGGDGTAVASGTFLGDTGATFTTFTGGTNKYSIRADYLS